MSDEDQQPNPPPAPPNPERKSLDDRARMTELERIRHLCAHVMATAILRRWPEAQFAYGPPVENEFRATPFRGDVEGPASQVVLVAAD